MINQLLSFTLAALLGGGVTQSERVTVPATEGLQPRDFLQVSSTADAMVPAKGDELVRRLAAGPITYVRLNGETVKMTFSRNGDLRLQNLSNGRVTEGSWFATSEGVVWQILSRQRFGARFEWLSDTNLIIQWIGVVGVRSIPATQEL